MARDFKYAERTAEEAVDMEADFIKAGLKKRFENLFDKAVH